MYYIFDLDNTVIDSSHRQTFVDGKLDLDAWKRDNTKKNIRKDSLLPIANIMKSAARFGHHVIVCTARNLCAWDLNFLADNGLRYNTLLYRPIGNDQPDAELKHDLLINYFSMMGVPLARWVRTAVFYDDNMSVLKMARDLGIRCKDATKLNTELLLAREVRA